MSGFWAKLLIIYACLESRHYILGAVAAVVGLMTLFSMIKIWSEAFWKPMPGNPSGPAAVKPLSAWMMAPVMGLALITVLTGLFIEPVYRFALAAGEQLMNPTLYILAVKGGG